MAATGALSAQLRRAVAELRAAQRVLVVTGAGISAESGVPTFRGPEGLWQRYRPEDLATPEAFARDPKLVWEWYASRREGIAPCRPNAAHRSLVELEQRVGEGFLLATQNVDGLHQLAGSRRLVELHGCLWRLRCLACGHSEEDRRVPLPELPPRCAQPVGGGTCAGLRRPDVVWFSEMLPEAALRAAFASAEAADVVLVIGTSSLVYPAALLPDVAAGAGASVVEVNPEVTPLSRRAQFSLRGTAAELVPALVGASP